MPTFGRTVLGNTGTDIQVTADGSPQWKAGGITLDWATVTAEAADRTLTDGTVIASGAKGLEAGTIVCAIGVAEVQTVTLTGSPAGGTFTLEGNGAETDTIAYNASAATVQTAIQALGGDYVDVVVTGSAGGPWTVTYPVGAGNVAQLTLGDNNLTGGTSPNVALATSTAGTSVGTYGPYASNATDGRQTLTRGLCWILNATVTELGPLGLGEVATDHPAVFDGGRVWRERLKIGGTNPTSIGGNEPTVSAFETAFPRVQYADL